MDDIVREALEAYNLAYDYEHENIEKQFHDLEFLIDSWDANLRKERQAANRPCFSSNRLPQFLKQVTGEMRKNNISIKVLGVDDQGDDETAEVMTGLIRNIENQSVSKSAYMIAAESQVTCGIGHWRIVNEYTDDDVFDQDLLIKGIRNPHAVMWDPNSELITRADADWCVLHHNYTKEAFEQRYPKALLSSFEESTAYGRYRHHWYTTDMIRVAEYWKKEDYKRTLIQLQDGRVIDGKDHDKETLSLLAPYIHRELKRDAKRIKKYTVNGVEELEPVENWPGKYIPIIPVIGEEKQCGDHVERHGLIRFAKDSQRLYDIWRTAEAEQVALQPLAPFIGTHKMFARHQATWALANTKPVPYLPYDPDPEAPGGKPERSQPPVMSSGHHNQALMAAEDIKASMGIYDASLGARSNESSGKAIIARQQEGDTATYVYIDNMAMAIEHTGRVLVDLIPHFYDTARIVRTLGADDTTEYVRINQPIMTPNGPIVINDLTTGKYDVIVTTGPSYATKRMETANAMLQFLQAMPNAAPVVGDLFAKALDFPDADEIAERLRKVTAMQMPGLLEPKDGEELPQQPDPMQNPELQMKLAEMQTKLAEAEANVKLTEAKAANEQADTVQKQVEIAAQTGMLNEIIRTQVGAILSELLQPPPNPPTAQPFQAQPAQATEAGFLMPEAGTGAEQPGFNPSQ